MNGEIKELIEQKIAENKSDYDRLATIEAIAEGQYNLLETHIQHQKEMTALYRKEVCTPRGNTIEALKLTVYRWGGALSVIALIFSIFGSKIIAMVWG